MSSDPSYVRLANRLSRGMVADLNSGWSIAGLDVRKFPKEDTVAAKFVRRALDSGKLEHASKAEWEDVHDDSFAEAMRDENPAFGVTIQEAKIQRAANESREKLAAKRGDKRSAEEVYDEEVRQPRMARKNALPEDLDELSKPDLQKLAKARGLSTAGTKDDIIERLEESAEDDEADEDESEDE